MANQPQIFKYEPKAAEAGNLEVSNQSTFRKSTSRLCKTDLVQAAVKVFIGGGENELHYHTGNDGFWMIREGRARFCGESGAVIAELGKNEGILIPRGFSYWFQIVGDEPLEVLHVAAKAQDTKDVQVHPLRAKSAASA